MEQAVAAWLIIVLALWVLAIVLGAWVNHGKGRSRFVGGLIGGLFGLIGVIVLAIIPANKRKLWEREQEWQEQRAAYSGAHAAASEPSAESRRAPLPPPPVPPAATGRPWYKKKRYILGVPLAVLVLLVVVGSLVETEEDATDATASSSAADISTPTPDSAQQVVAETTPVKTATPSPTPSPTKTPPPTATSTPTPGIGATVRVGDLDLTVLSAEPFDARGYNQFNEANYRVRFRATNSRGAANSEYNISILAFKLVDSSGVALNYETCAGCPDALSGGADLVKGGTYEGSVYFNLPAGRNVVELRYQPVFSTNRVTIPLR